MSKDLMKCVANARNTSSESDNDICIIENPSDSTVSDNTTVLSERLLSESPTTNEEKLKRKCVASSDNSDLDNRVQNKNEDLFVIDKNGESPFMYGFFTCEACDVVLQTQNSFEKHLSNVKHKKAVKRFITKVDGAAKRSAEIEPTNHGCKNKRITRSPVHGIHSKYPPIQPGVIKHRIKDESDVQYIVEGKNFPPCPGLEKVTEVRGLTGTYYFCDICDKRFEEKEDIIDHLKSQKHQIKCLKILNRKWYEELHSMPKKFAKNCLRDMLKHIQDSEGRGKINVEKEYYDNYGPKNDTNLDCLAIMGSSSDSPSTSNVLIDDSKCSYFCLVCECNLSNVALWESHSNSPNFNRYVKKYALDKIIKSTAKQLSKAMCFLTARISENDHNDPIVGLDFIREMQHIAEKKETYHCFLCGDCLTCLDIMSHITMQRHRINYIERINHVSVDVVRSYNARANRTYYIVGEICREIEREYGRGCPEVYAIEKS